MYSGHKNCCYQHETILKNYSSEVQRLTSSCNACSQTDAGYCNENENVASVQCRRSMEIVVQLFNEYRQK